MTCSADDQPKITYTFGNNPSKTFQSPNAPIDIQTGNTPIGTTSNYNATGYQISFSSPQGAYGSITENVVDYELVTRNDGKPGILLMGCGSTVFSSLDDATWITSSVTANSAVHCPTPNNQRCTIQVNYGGSTIFQDQGDCPVSFSVQCGQCPDGQIQCSCPGYPGYCCIDCNSLQSPIQGMINQIQSIK